MTPAPPSQGDTDAAVGQLQAVKTTNAFQKAVLGALVVLLGLGSYTAARVAAIATDPVPTPTTTTVVPVTSSSSTSTTKPPASTTTTKPPATTTTKPPVVVTTGFPDATTTGVPAGTTLKRVPQDITSGTGWHWDTRGWLQVDSPNAVVDGVSISSGASIDVCEICTNTLIKRTKIVSDGYAAILVRINWDTRVGASGTTIQDTTIIGGTSGLGTGISSQGGVPITVTRVDISRSATPVQIDRGLVQDSYLHDIIIVPGGDHLNGITSNGNGTAGSLVIRHNTVLNSGSQTDAVSLFQDFGVQANVTIDNNLLAGGGYVIYGGEGGKGPTSNIKITNNRISTRYFAQGGFYGWLAHFTPTDPGNVAAGNVWHESGVLITGQ